MGRLLPKLSPEVLHIGSDPVRGSMLVAKRFWKRPRQAVLAAADDAEGIILGSALASRMSVPLLIRRRSEPRDSLAGILVDLGVKAALAVVADPEHAPGWANSRKYKVEAIGPRAAQERLVELVGAKNIHTVVVARVPDKRAAVGSTAWLGPYWSLVRGAPLVLGHTASAAAVEAAVGRLIDAQQLKPRTITVLADYDSIADNFVEIDPGTAVPPRSRGPPR